ncbi:MAG: 2-oxo acid dehydrogenase subunit E2 [Methylococcaceae bacterium]|nr:2-oxo acid dehydrogenase subunit E2 [Methylococcaceae bacterium]MCI0733267.1 2-oxo acid dehydrogenase subunit E2 [Methylococcaceae bacterium]
MRYFKLPDLGEGLQEAEIVQWNVSVGDEVKQDQVLVAVETAKAIVELPSPCEGKILKLYGNIGEILHIGDPLVEFVTADELRKDKGSVVGQVEAGDKHIDESPITVGHSSGTGVKATPAVRALANRLNVEIDMVKATGKGGNVTVEDIHRAAKLLAEAGEMEPLRGVRRAMAQTMSQAHREVVAVTLNDDADIHAWQNHADVSIRLIRAIVAACRAEPALNAWYNSHAVGRILPKKIDLGIAVDTDQGLFVPVLRDVGNRETENLRRALDAIKEAVAKRSINPEDMRGYTITLSNFGTFAGRYANPIVVPPTVAIIGAGKIRDQIVPEHGNTAIHSILPISLTFDHRAVTGGEAARFLKVLLNDLEKPA